VVGVLLDLEALRPKVSTTESRTTMPLLVSFAYSGWVVDLGLVPM
jgi:hypothetical protein